jgi:prepilin-type N-terminal cleavage/methylation domain-containing protein
MKNKIEDRVAARGFSLVEVMVASTIAVMVFTTGAVLYHAVSFHQRRLSVYESVELGASALANYYGMISATSIDVYTAPHYGRAAWAENLRDKFWEDTRSASAVYCLGRNGLNTFRPDFISIPLSTDAKALDSAEAFRQYLEVVEPSTLGVFEPYRGASTAPNGSVFILERSSFGDFLAVKAIYEIDIQATTAPSGTYASVRRYAQGRMTEFYDVFYPTEQGVEAFSPLFVQMERRERKIIAEPAYDKFKKASGMPFYLMWWPDPGTPNLKGEGMNTTGLASSDPRSTYANMGGKTAFMFTVPLFPAY